MDISDHEMLSAVLLRLEYIMGFFSSYAIDIFDQQDLNIDFSGSGSKNIFISNLEKFDHNKGANVKLIAADSTVLEIEKMVETPVRIFSIDGGHTAEHTISDLKKVQTVLHPEGIVILDDILNHHWLGVIEGLLFFLQEKPTLLPFAIGHNKLFMAKLSHLERYAELFRKSPHATKHNVTFMGRNLVAL
jgi:Methyltransferase domain